MEFISTAFNDVDFSTGSGLPKEYSVRNVALVKYPPVRRQKEDTCGAYAVLTAIEWRLALKLRLQPCTLPKFDMHNFERQGETETFKIRGYGIWDVSNNTEEKHEDLIKILKLEIYRHGPIVVQFLPDENYMADKTGKNIYTGPTSPLIKKIINGKERPISHIIVLTGWRTQDNLDCFEYQNSWGKKFGEASGIPGYGLISVDLIQGNEIGVPIV
ncbi:hypothetical protein Ancab_039381 [Ancistrocladus abbreviatus]